MRKYIMRNLMGAPKVYPTPISWIIPPSEWLKKAIEELKKVEESAEI